MSNTQFKSVTMDGITHEFYPENEVFSEPRSFNNRLIVESYQKRAPETKLKSGFAHTEQKVTVKGLQVLMDAKLADGTFVKKGSTAYIKESKLHSEAWAAQTLESATLGSQFIIVDMSNVEWITPPTEPAA